MRWVWALAGALLLPGSALASDQAVTLDLKAEALYGISQPLLRIAVHEDLHEVAVRVSSPGNPTVRRTVSSPRDGDRIELALPVKSPGTHRFQGHLTAVFPGGERAQMPLDFTVRSLVKLRVRVDADPESVAAGRLVARAEGRKRLVRFELRVFDDHGLLAGEHRGSVGDDGAIAWPAPEGPVGKLELKLYARDGTHRQVSLFPWRIDVPHEEVHFATGSADIPAPEVPKLRASLAQIRKELARVRPWADPELFVAGHTDTVGSAAANRTLSKRRARSIARWFRQAGLTVPVRYAGFGESVLAQPTPDETESEANRRAEYIIAVDPPPLPSGGPRWIRLQR